MATKHRGPHATQTAHTGRVAPASPAARPNPGATGRGPSEPPAAVVPHAGDDERSRTIRVRDYGLWERDGRPDGETARLRCWFEAERELTPLRTA